MGDSIFAIIEDLSPRDKVLEYLKSSRKADMFLTAAEMEYCLKLDYTDDIIRAHFGASDKQLINMLVEKYSISLSQARNLLFDARYVHGAMAKPVKAYERQRLVDFLRALAEKCEKAGKYKEAIAAAELITKLQGLDTPDEDQPEEETGVRILRPAFAPETLGVELPENVDELILELRTATKTRQKVLMAAKPDGTV